MIHARPKVAALVGDPLRLELLRALTEADSLATGPSAWSAWKATLIDELTAAVSAIFAGRPKPTLEAAPDDRYRDLIEDVRASGQLHSRHESAGDFDLWVIATPDQPGLFAKIAGAFAMHGVDVVTAEAWTSTDGIAVDQFRVSRSVSGRGDWSKSSMTCAAWSVARLTFVPDSRNGSARTAGPIAAPLPRPHPGSRCSSATRHLHRRR